MDNDKIIKQRHSRLLGKEHWFHKDNVKEMLNEARQSERAKIMEMLKGYKIIFKLSYDNMDKESENWEEIEIGIGSAMYQVTEQIPKIKAELIQKIKEMP